MSSNENHSDTPQEDLPVYSHREETLSRAVVEDIVMKGLDQHLTPLISHLNLPPEENGG